MILKKYDIPVYATEGTIRGIRLSDKNHEMDDKDFRVVRSDECVQVGDLNVNPMHISHDALEPVGYRILHNGRKVAVVTDLGCYDDYTVECLKGCSALLLEANHDLRMLQAGPYPYRLKVRIAGDKGHLSNEKSGELLCRLLNDNIRGIFLGHLSDRNNMPELAYETVRVSVDMSDIPYRSSDFPIYVAKRGEISQVIEV
jgi:phosphoribosyl 1,2-cyclic phosphodiesterase